MSEGGIKIQRKRPFTQIDNEMIMDQRLSCMALGLGVRMLRLPPDKVYSFKYIRRLAGANIGRDTVRKLLKELVDAGYLKKEQTHDESGRFARNTYILVDIPEVQPLTEIPSTATPSTAAPSTANQSGKEISSKNNTPPIVPQDILTALEKYANGDTDLFAALRGFAEKRAKERNPLNTQRMVTLLINKLDKLSGGDDAVKVAMLDKAVNRNWASVYALNERDLEDLRREKSPPQRRQYKGTEIIDGREVDVYE